MYVYSTYLPLMCVHGRSVVHIQTISRAAAIEGGGQGEFALPVIPVKAGIQSGRGDLAPTSVALSIVPMIILRL